MQHVLAHGSADNVSRVVERIKGQVLYMSQHKFASNVVEKCVQHCATPDRTAIVREVCHHVENVAMPSQNGIGQTLVPTVALQIMIRDQYGNFVVQKMIDLADAEQLQMLVAEIKPHSATLRSFQFGKHIINKLEKLGIV